MPRRGGCLARAIRKVFSLALALFLFVYPFVEPFWISLDYKTLYSADLPVNFDGLRVAFVSDIHQGPFFSRQRLDALVEQINAWHPDIVLLGGDYATDSDTAIAFFAQQPGFTAPLGVFAVPGNHDRVMPESNLPRLLQAMRDAGVTPLCNAVVPVKANGQSIYIAGVDDYSVGHPDIAGVAAQCKAKNFTLFLLHNPDGLPAAYAAKDAGGSAGWADAILCGHTHGGQVTVFGQRALKDINYQTGERYRTGWRHESGADILISNGIGTSFLPIRFFARPQIHFITFKRLPN